MPREKPSAGRSVIYDGGVPKSINILIIFVTACIVCSLTIYCAKEYIPDGTYLIGCFLPFAFVGWIAGMIAVNIVNLLFSVIWPRR